jgi:hypothetical protein
MSLDKVKLTILEIIPEFLKDNLTVYFDIYLKEKENR